MAFNSPLASAHPPKAIPCSLLLFDATPIAIPSGFSVVAATPIATLASAPSLVDASFPTAIESVPFALSL